MQGTWDEIYEHLSVCTQADIMLIAEAPGAQEDQQGVPFVGRSGEVLDRLLLECGLGREELYITNIIKCHPPGNRDPNEEEKRRVFRISSMRRIY